MPMEVVLGVVGAWAGLHWWKSKAAAAAITAQHSAAWRSVGLEIFHAGY